MVPAQTSTLEEAGCEFRRKSLSGRPMSLMADVAAIGAFLMSPQEAIRRRGYDPDRVMADFKSWHDRFAQAGLVSDADPALVPTALPRGSAGHEIGN